MQDNYESTVGPITAILQDKWDAKVNAMRPASVKLAYPDFADYLRYYEPQLLVEAIKWVARCRDIRNTDAFFSDVVIRLHLKALHREAAANR